MSESIWVQGKLYSSPLFLDTHQDLQDSPGVPGCVLPQVVDALMFLSDLTHLTAFGNAKLWQLYILFEMIPNTYVANQQVTYANMLLTLSK